MVELRHKHSAAIEDLNEQMDSLKKTRQQLEKTKQQLEAENADLAHDIKGETPGGGRGPDRRVLGRGWLVTDIMDGLASCVVAEPLSPVK